MADAAVAPEKGWTGGDFTRLAVFGILYSAAAHGALLFLVSPDGVAVVWPGSGVFLAALLIFRRSQWWAVIGVLAFLDLVASLTTGGIAPLPAVIFTLSPTGEAILAAASIRYFRKHPLTFAALGDFYALLFLGCIMAPAVMAVPSALTIQILFGADFMPAWWSWAIADGMGTLTVAPLLLLWHQRPGQFIGQLTWPRRAEFVVLLVALAWVTGLVFTTANPEGAPLATYSYLPFPVLIWIAIRFGPYGATMAAFVLTGVALLYEGRGVGDWVLLREGFVVLQAFLIVMISAALLLAIVIAEREAATRLLRESRTRLELALEGADLGLWDWDCRTGTTVYNPRWATMLGYNSSEFDPHGRHWERLLHPDDRNAAIERFNQHLKGETPMYEAEFRMRAKNGQWRWILGRGKVVERDENGEPLRVTGTHLDIHERKTAEAANVQLGRIIEGASNEIYLFDAQTLRFVDVNRGARDNLGYTLDELTKMTPESLDPEMTPERFEALAAPLRNQSASEIRFSARHRRKDGSSYAVEILLQLVIGESGPLFFADVHDVTDRLATEQQLRQAQKMEAVGQLTGGVAHDFNNLLAIMIGNLELLVNELPEDSTHRERVSTAMNAAERGAELTRRLLAFSRQQPLAPQSLDLNRLVSNMMEMLRRALGETIEIETVLAGGLWQTRADPGQVEAALLNLAVNARDALPNGGRLTIETGNVKLDDTYAAAQPEVAPGQYVMIAVTDTGYGMPENVREHAFEPFFTTKEVSKGTGLGLSMVYGFCKQSGGHVAIYSEQERGTTVKMYLPRTTAKDDTTPEPPVSGRELKAQGEKVLVVEDDADVRDITVTMLEDMGYTVLSAPDGKTALATAETENSITLLVTDVVLKGDMSGRQIAESLTKTRPDLRVLFMSGYTENSVLHHGRLDDGVVLLQKPFRKRDLARKISQVLRRNTQQNA